MGKDFSVDNWNHTDMNQNNRLAGEVVVPQRVIMEQQIRAVEQRVKEGIIKSAEAKRIRK